MRCLSEVTAKRIWLSETNISGFINVWTTCTTVGKTCHTVVRVTSQFYCWLSSCESIDRTLSWVIWSQSCQQPALSLREEQLVTSLGVEINGGSPPGDGWWEYITTNKCLPRCRRRQSLTCWLLSTQGGAEGSRAVHPDSLLPAQGPARVWEKWKATEGCYLRMTKATHRQRLCKSFFIQCIIIFFIYWI